MEIFCLGCMEQIGDEEGVCHKCGYTKGTPPSEAYHLFPGTIIKEKYIIL